MADKTPKELIGILFVVFIFLFGFAGFYTSLSISYDTGYTDLATFNKTEEIFTNIEDSFQTINETMTQNPKSGDSFNVFLDTPGMLATAGASIGYMFLSIPGWFQALFYDMSNAVGVIPAIVIIIAIFFILMDVLAWVVYFWTNRRT